MQNTHEMTVDRLLEFFSGRQPVKPVQSVQPVQSVNPINERVQALLTQAIRSQIPPLYSQEKVKDPMVYARFFSLHGSGTWLATEFDGKDTFFGFVMGFAHDELGYFSLKELESIKWHGIQGVERDQYFKPKPLSQAKRA